MSPGTRTGRALGRCSVVCGVVVAFLTSAGVASAGNNPKPGDIAAVAQYRESLPTSGGSSLSTPAKPAPKPVVHSAPPAPPPPAPAPAPVPAPVQATTPAVAPPPKPVKKITRNPLSGAPQRPFDEPPPPPASPERLTLSDVGFGHSIWSSVRALFAEAGGGRLLGLVLALCAITAGGVVLASRGRTRARA